jgi:hypothetical protein
METFSSYTGQSGSTFFTHAPTISNFKAMIKYIITRVNTITNIAYKDDTSILAWETGNELINLDNSIVPGAWSIDIASYIKSIDGNHLVMDGSYMYYGISSLVLSSPHIDILTNHYYDNPRPPPVRSPNNNNEGVRNEPGRWTFADRVHADAEMARRAGKAFVVGEVGLCSLSDIKATLATIKNDPSVSGALLWSLRYKWHFGFGIGDLESFLFYFV